MPSSGCLVDEPGQRLQFCNETAGDGPVDSEDVYVEHDGRLFLLTLEYAREAADVCRPAWHDMLHKWQWFEPEFAVYRNADYGYAISYPRSWYRFNAQERGISISSRDPAGITDQGPLGDIYVVTCLYRADQEDEFQPIANAIIFSLEF